LPSALIAPAPATACSGDAALQYRQIGSQRNDELRRTKVQ
jgi:hypothetical protein